MSFLSLLFIASEAFAAPLPIVEGANRKTVNSSTVHTLVEEQAWLGAAQTHAGKEIFTLGHNNSPLYFHYLERYSSPEQLRWLDTVMERADIFIDFIDDAVFRSGIPFEIMFLPVTESAFRSNAVSRSGAVGLWQFMKNSISPYGMKVDDWADERRDFWKATEGAIEKLKYNYDQMGDWHLALAAYNCGLGRVQRTIAATGIHDYWELSEKGLLPNETIHYVPRFLALARILSHAGRSGTSVPWREPYRWERVALPGPVSLTKLSELAGLPLDLVRNANAELRYDITPAGNYYLKVPAGKADTVREVVSRPGSDLMKFHIYQIKSGDTLYDLGRHYGVSVAMIQDYNRGLNPSALSIGRKILVPALKNVPPYTGKAAMLPEKNVKPVITDPEKYRGSHIVAAGDTLWSIARKYGTDPYNVAHHNGIHVDTILPIGLELRVPEADS